MRCATAPPETPRKRKNIFAGYIWDATLSLYFSQDLNQLISRPGLFLTLTGNFPPLPERPFNLKSRPQKLLDNPDVGEEMQGNGLGGEPGRPLGQGQINQHLIGQVAVDGGAVGPKAR